MVFMPPNIFLAFFMKNCQFFHVFCFVLFTLINLDMIEYDFNIFY